MTLKGTTLGVLCHICKDFVLQLVRGTIGDPARKQERDSVPIGSGVTFFILKHGPIWDHGA